jgi:gluconate 2-dehydrogenase gamma chain
MTFISRRELLKRAGAVGAAAVVAERAIETRAGETRPAEAFALQAQASARRAPVEHLTAAEADLLDAIVARLIPTDEHGPGAKEARVVHYIDRALGSALGSSRQAYTAGLAALDRYARTSRGAPFAQLSPVDQDSALIDVETGTATGFTGGSAAFFAMVLGHTHQGMFGDPYYGGNADCVGWDLVGYPGVRTMVTAADQKQLEQHQLKPNHKSAYDYESFTKASARLAGGGSDERGA